MLDDFSIPAKQRLLTYLIEQEPGLGLTNSNLALSSPRHGVFTEKNTEVTVSYKETLIHKPTAVIHYNRLNLQSYFQNHVGIVQPPLNALSDLNAVLSAVLSQYATALTTDDVDMHVGTSTITLIAKTASYGWTGSISFLTSSSGFELDEDGGELLQLDDDNFFELD